ncbi:MAG: alkaline phosphatase D family protein [Planctomycetota bacterium]|nr:alkaline phosphatase D family protein [Planctomycetota bacterium]
MKTEKSGLLAAIVIPIFLALGCRTGSVVQDPGFFHSDWSGSPERTWVGPEYWANRLQDWRLHAGRLECTESRENFPLRTLHLLTRSSSSRPGTLEMSVITGPVDAGSPGTLSSWSGFLIGAGGEHVDYRLTAQVHHRPAADGGLWAVIDGAGVVAFRDNSRASKGGNLWNMAGRVRAVDVPLIEVEPSSRRGGGFRQGGGRAVKLRLSARPEGSAYRLTLTARDLETEELVSEASVRGVPAHQVDGGLALVSHRGPVGGRGGFWFRDWRIAGSKVEAHEERAFGPVLCAQHTVSGGTLKLTAQMGPLGKDDSRQATLEMREPPAREWKPVATAELVEDSFTFPFRVEGPSRVEGWSGDREAEYRVVYELRRADGRTTRHEYTGKVRREAAGREEFVIAAFTGHKIFTGGLQWNHDGLWFPHGELVRAVAHHEPDFLFFSGDQIYEGDLTPAVYAPLDKALGDYLYKWYRWCWAFQGLLRDIPAVTIPDDHDVYHGNIWGAGGCKTAGQGFGQPAQDSGGYKMPARFVNAVHRTQTSHLPDPVDPRPIDQGISVYFTRVEYDGVSFAVLADRMWKSSPTVLLPEGKVVNGWFQNRQFDPAKEADAPGAVLLGERQLAFLREWSTDWSGGAWMKVALSQTIFANVATLPAPASSDAVVPQLPYLPYQGYPDTDQVVADADSNGWPQTGRNRAIRELRRGFALHIAGDQHLGSTVQYGVDGWRDAGFALCVPSVANTWPRRWYPPEPGGHRDPKRPRYTGDYLDGFGNHVTVYAVSNPVISGRRPANLYDRAPGYGIVRLHRRSRAIDIECWPRWVDPSEPRARPYRGWPLRIHQVDNYRPEPSGYLPRIDVVGMEDPVVQVIDESSGEIVYALRIAGRTFRPPVYGQGSYTVVVGEPGNGRVHRFEKLTPGPESSEASVEASF